MGKTAIVFPGQGAQYVGMGKDFYDRYDVCRDVMQQASQVTGLDICGLCFEENQQLNITEYTQIAMVAVEAAMLKAVQKAGLQADVYAGLSLEFYLWRMHFSWYAREGFSCRRQFRRAEP